MDWKGGEVTSPQDLVGRGRLEDLLRCVWQFTTAILTPRKLREKEAKKKISS